GWPGQAHQRLLSDPVLTRLAGQFGATSAQLALAWLLDVAPNILLIPGTRSRGHLADNLAGGDIRLDHATRTELVRRFPPTRSPALSTI
ncbi:MAG TPA: aldo/keto reductase, partial [Micromonosporaceae bacterium]|nr:aldo/keto reductase [Micromonosporaceae bacterium]